MSEVKFFTTDGQEIARLGDATLVPECLEEEIQEMVFERLKESYEAEFKVDTRGSDLLRFKITMVLGMVLGITIWNVLVCLWFDRR